MLRVLEITFPVFALVFCGFFGQRWRILPERAVEGINAFVFFFALPAMLFRVVATQPLASFVDWRFAAAYVTGGLIVLLLTRAAALGGAPPGDDRQRSARRSQAAAFGLSASHGNLGYMGIPLAIELGRQYLPTMILAIVCDIFVLITLSIALLELNRRRSQGRQSAPRIALVVVSGLARSPLVLSIGLGLAWSLAAPEMPETMDNFTRILGSAAGPCALFAIGASLGDRRIVIDHAVAALITFKLVVHPALAAVLMLFVFSVDPASAAVGVLAASLPGASNSFIIARRYGVDTREISAATLAGTFIALATVSLVIWAFGLRAA
ncbi:MAG TPA: AEC family transporter [Burkholderiaceae bacterium]